MLPPNRFADRIDAFFSRRPNGRSGAVTARTKTRFGAHPGTRRIKSRNEDALSPADGSRRDVLLGGLMATAAAALPAAAFAQTNLPSSPASKGPDTMNTVTTKDGTQIFY